MDLTITGVAILPIPSGIVIFISSLVFGFDPFYAVFGDLLGDPQYRNTPTWCFVLCFIIRALLTSASFEVARSVALSLSRDLVIIDALETSLAIILKLSKQQTARVETLAKYYRLLTIPGKSLANFQDEVVAIAFSSMFWIFLFIGWVILFGYSLVLLHMYVLLCLLFFLGFPCALVGCLYFPAFKTPVTK